MQQTFRKTIQGHSIQFNRLLFPIRYSVKLDDMESAGEINIINYKSSGWELSRLEGIPSWLKQTLPDIISIVEENEKSAQLVAM